MIRTPAAAGNYTFAGDSLTIAPAGGMYLKGANGNIITISNLILAGTIHDTINPVTIGSVAGNLIVSGQAALDTSSGASDFRILTNGMAMSGTGTLTNTCTMEPGYPGIVVYTANNSAFTGPLIVNSTRRCRGFAGQPGRQSCELQPGPVDAGRWDLPADCELRHEQRQQRHHHHPQRRHV